MPSTMRSTSSAESIASMACATQSISSSMPAIGSSGGRVVRTGTSVSAKARGGGGGEKSTSPANPSNPPKARRRGGSTCTRAPHCCPDFLAAAASASVSSGSAGRVVAASPPSAASCARAGGASSPSTPRTCASWSSLQALAYAQRSCAAASCTSLAGCRSASSRTTCAALARSPSGFSCCRSRPTSFSAASGCALAGSANSGGIATSVGSAASGR